MAEERGFFAKEGVAVELINIDDHTAAFAGLFAGQVDAVAAGTQHVLTFSEPDEERLVRVLPLEGKSVAVLRGSLQHFYLNILLKQARLTEADIEIVDLPADDSAEVFMMQEVDAAVTCEPSLSLARTRSMVTTDRQLEATRISYRLPDNQGGFPWPNGRFRALGRAWVDAVDYFETDPDQAIKIMARNVGGWLENTAAFAEVLNPHFPDAAAWG